MVFGAQVLTHLLYLQVEIKMQQEVRQQNQKNGMDQLGQKPQI